MLYFNTLLTYISRTEGLNFSCDLDETCFPSPNKYCLWYVFDIYANLICVSCKYDVASNLRWNVAKVIA